MSSMLMNFPIDFNYKCWPAYVAQWLKHSGTVCSRAWCVYWSGFKISVRVHPPTNRIYLVTLWQSRPNKASLKWPSIRTYVYTYVRTYVCVRTSVCPSTKSFWSGRIFDIWPIWPYLYHMTLRLAETLLLKSLPSIQYRACLFQIFSKNMMNSEIIPDTKRGFDGVLYIVWSYHI